MSETEYPYEGRDRYGDTSLRVEKGGAEDIVLSLRCDKQYLDHVLPTDPAELHKLTEAILGRKVAAVIYEDEAPGVANWEVDLLTPPNRERDAIAYHRTQAAIHAVAARHIEARDAAAKERERAEEERRNQQAAAWRLFALTVTGRPHSSIVVTDVAILCDALIDAGIEPPKIDESGRVLAGEEADRG